MSKVWNKDSIGVLLEHSNEALERAIVFLYRQQTAEEQATGTTQEKNNRGFNAADAKNGAYMATWIINERNPGRPRHLTGKWIGIAREMVRKYAGQLTDFANSDAKMSQPKAAATATRTPVPSNRRNFVRA
jgi:hypothetical protein